MYPEGVHPSATRTEAPALGTLPDRALCISSPDYSPVSFLTSFNKVVNVRKCFPEFSEPL